MCAVFDHINHRRLCMMNNEKIIVSPVNISLFEIENKPPSTESTCASLSCDDEESQYSLSSKSATSTAKATCVATGNPDPSSCCRRSTAQSSSYYRRPHRKLARDTMMMFALILILAGLIGVVVLVGVPVALNGDQKFIAVTRTTDFNETLRQFVASDLVLGMNKINRREKVLFLYDLTGSLEVNLQKTDSLQEASPTPSTMDETQTIVPPSYIHTSSWDSVQPTESSLQQMQSKPHVQTGQNGGQQLLEISPTFDLRADHNWTLSFAGARLFPSNDEESSPSSVDVLFSSSLFPFCQVQYEDNNTLGLYLAGMHHHNYTSPKPSTTTSGHNGTTTATTRTSRNSMITSYHGISLPFDSYEAHVLTITFDQKTQQLELYQNKEFVTAIDFEDGWAALNLIGGGGLSSPWNVPPPPAQENSTTATNLDSPDNQASSSNLAIQRVTYFQRSFHGDEEVAHLVEYMMSC